MPIDNKSFSVTMNFTVSNTCRPPNNTIKYIKVYSCRESTCETICAVQYKNGTCPQLLRTKCPCDPQTQQFAVKGRVNGSRCKFWKLEGQLKNDHNFTKNVTIPCKLSISLFGHKPNSNKSVTHISIHLRRARACVCVCAVSYTHLRAHET